MKSIKSSLKVVNHLQFARRKSLVANRKSQKMILGDETGG